MTIGAALFSLFLIQPKRKCVCLLYDTHASTSPCVCVCCLLFPQSKSQPQRRGEYNVYSTFQSHEPEFDYLKSLEIEEKINKIKWLPQQNAAYFLLSTNGQSDS